MPSPEEESVRRLYQALVAADTATIGELLHPDCSGVMAAGMPAGAGEHASPAAMWEDGWMQIGRVFAAGAEPTEITPLVDSRLLVVGRYTGHGRRGGGPLDAAFTHVVSFTDGRIRNTCV